MPNRKVYDADFKVGAVKLVESSDKPIAQIATELGIRSGLLYNWVKQSRQPDEVKSAMEHLSKQEEEIKSLKKELKMVKEERDILKKAVGYFAKSPQ